MRIPAEHNEDEGKDNLKMKCSLVLSDTKLHLKEGWEVTIALFNENITQWNDWFNELNCILLESELDTIIEGYTFKNWQWEKIFRE